MARWDWTRPMVLSRSKGRSSQAPFLPFSSFPGGISRCWPVSPSNHQMRREYTLSSSLSLQRRGLRARSNESLYWRVNGILSIPKAFFLILKNLGQRCCILAMFERQTGQPGQLWRSAPGLSAPKPSLGLQQTHHHGGLCGARLTSTPVARDQQRPGHEASHDLPPAAIGP